MTHNLPHLPESTFAPLSASKLEAMIDRALTHPQQQASNVVAFRRPWATTAGLTAMAASILLAFMVTPAYTPSGSSTGTAVAQSDTTDVSDLLLLESFGA